MEAQRGHWRHRGPAQPPGHRCRPGHVERVFTSGTKPVLVVFARTPGVRVAARMNVMPGDADF
jgi:hypothetical protein